MCLTWVELRCPSWLGLSPYTVPCTDRCSARLLNKGASSGLPAEVLPWCSSDNISILFLTYFFKRIHKSMKLVHSYGTR